MTMQEIQEKLQGVVDEIVKEFQPEKIILFGSFAWGEPNPDSDVDLFIVKETKNTRETARKISRLIFPRPFPMDIIVYNPNKVRERLAMNDFFLKDIFSKGKFLYESK
jgi:predicted nucleotidyltransferase